jgi:DNA-binding MarR family transcriptional regulator
MAGTNKDDLAEAAWALMFDFMMATSPDRTQSLERRGLTPNDARALSGLDRRTGTPIGSLARDWRCDPANATFIIDRLERAGLAERRESDTDRRVKLVTLTSKGATTRQALMDEFRVPPAAMKALTREDLQTLIGVLRKLGTGAG